MSTPLKLLRLAVGFLTLLLLSSCGSMFSSPSSESSQSASTVISPGVTQSLTTSDVPPSAATIKIATSACLDPSGSTGRLFPTQFRSLLSGAVGSWIPEPPANDSIAHPRVPGLHLVMRAISSTSASTDQAAPVVDISGIDASLSKPAATVANYAEELAAYKSNQATVSAQRAQARTDQAKAVKVVEAFKPKMLASAILACINTAVLDSDPGTRLSVIVGSDFVNNVPAEFNQLTQNLARVRILLVQACPSGSISDCQTRANSFRTSMHEHGALSAEAVQINGVDGTWLRNWLLAGAA